MTALAYSDSSMVRFVPTMGEADTHARPGIREMMAEEIEAVSGMDAATQGSNGAIAGAAAGAGFAVARGAATGARVGIFGGLVGVGAGAVIGGVIGYGSYYFFGGGGGL